MNFFGEFLVEKGYLSEEHLVQALLEQLKTTPPSAEILHATKKLTSKQLLEIFKTQSKEQLSFEAAATKLGVWNPQWRELIHQERENRKIPLGQVLVRNGCITAAQLTEATTLFLEKQNGTSSKPIATEMSDAPASFLHGPTGTRLAKKLASEFESLQNASSQTFPEVRDQIVNHLKVLSGSARLFEDEGAELLSQALEQRCAKATYEEATSLVQLGKSLLSVLLDTSHSLLTLENARAAIPELFNSEATTSAPKAVGGRKILVVDDSKAVHAFVDECLVNSGYQIKHVMNGAEGIEALSRESFDIVLLDWEMPTKTGPETFAEMKQRNMNPIVLMMTSRNSQEDISLMITAGVNEYIMKPFNAEVLNEKIALCLESMAFDVAA